MDAKQQLMEGMDERRKKALALVVGVDANMVVHPESGWRVKDLIAHLTAWEEEAATSLEAYNQGAPYVFPYLRAEIDEFNEKIYRARKDYSSERVMAEWAAARERLKAALRDVAMEKFEGLFNAPWEAGPVNVTQLIKGMGIHEKLHIGEIMMVKQQ